MISWRTPALQFLCLFVCRLHLTEANCAEALNPDYWEKATPKITLHNLTERIQLFDAHSFEDMMKCTLKNEIKKGRQVDHLLCQCMDYCENEFEQTPMNSLNCGKELLQSVSFLDFMCLVARASNVDNDIQACSHDVVVELYSRFHMTPIATTLPTTKQPPTTTNLTTTTAKSTTAEMSTKTSPSVTTWSTRPSASSAASQSTAGDVLLSYPDYIKQQTNKDTVVYSLLGLSVLINLVLAFALVCSWRRSTSESDNSAAQRDTQEISHLVTIENSTSEV